VRDVQNPFPVEEYRCRLLAVQAGLATRGLDGLLVTTPENVLYLTGYQTFGTARQFLVVPASGDPVFLLRELEAPLVAYTARFQDCRTYADSEDPLPVLTGLLRSLLGAGARAGIEDGPGGLSPAELARLREAGEGLALTAASGVVEARRVVKSPREIELCRQAAGITATGMRAAADAVRAGTSENHVAAAAAAAMTEAGSEWFAVSPIVTSGYRAGIPHTTYARRVIERGDTVLIELGACMHRHFGPLMRTCVVGEPDAETARMFTACREALEAAMAVIRPGVTSGQAHAACQEVIDRHGFTERFKKRLGYSVGIGLRSWSEAHLMDLKADDPRPLEAGMVFHMPPALRKAWRAGVGVSETIVVMEDGCEPLSSFPRELFVR
jgi:Xaa-Pro dipeptidase